MKEKLTCKKCEKNWSRQISRGRKPHFCPKCTKEALILPAIKINYSSIKKDQLPSNSVKSVSLKTLNKKQSAEQPIKGPSHWQCSSCLVSVSININIYEPPTHCCKKRLNKVFALEKVSKIK